MIMLVDGPIGVTPIEKVGDEEYLALLDMMRELHLKKARDYGNGEDPLMNLRASVALGIDPWVGCILRLNDKMVRVHSLIRNGSLANESIEDNLMDMASYALLALRLYRENERWEIVDKTKPAENC